MKKKKKILPIVVCALISLLVEIFIYNFRYFESYNYKHSLLTVDNIGSKIKAKKNNITVIGNNENEDNYIEIININKVAKNLNLDISNLTTNYIIYDLYVKDEGNSEYHKLPERYIYPNIKKSEYIKLDLSGKLKDIKIVFKDSDNTNFSFRLNSIKINCKSPMDISWTRCLLLFIILLSIYFIRYALKDKIVKVDFSDKKQMGFMIIVMLLFAAYFWYLMGTNLQLKTYGQQHNQYQQLAVSFSHKKNYLEIKPSKELSKMKNSYDFGYRSSHKVQYQWDTAYYKGKYYVYFGVVPEILTFLPYYLITKNNLPNYISIYIAIIFIILGVFFLEKEVVKKYFKNIPFLVFALIYIWFIDTMGLVGIACYPTLYNIPISYALAFTFWGLYFWISSVKDDGISKARIFLGSLCMALVAGCRPQLLLCSFFAFIIFKDTIKEKKLLSSDSKLNTFLALVPYIIVAVPLMLYNKSRFGSAFNFGANYNLTGNDMTRRGFNIDRIGLGLFTYLFQSPNVKATFPFLSGVKLETNYMGVTINELTFGGLLAINPILILGLISPKFKNKNNINMIKFCVWCIIFALIIVIADTEMAGILQRYFSDFSFLFGFATVIVIMMLFDKNSNKKFKTYALKIMIILIFIAIINQNLYIFDDQLYHDMINNNTAFYFKWYYLLQWWL